MLPLQYNREIFSPEDENDGLSVNTLESGRDGLSVSTLESGRDTGGGTTKEAERQLSGNELREITFKDEKLKNSEPSSINNSNLGFNNKALKMDDESDDISNETYTNSTTTTSGSHLLTSLPQRSSVASTSPRVTLEREAIEWRDFATKYGKQNLGRRISTTHKLVQTAGHCCDNCSVFGWLLDLFPFFAWIRNYSFHDNLLSDMIAGFTIAILHIPQGMAYGLLAGVSPINGLYVSFFPVLIYCLMGTSKHISIGTFAVISIMLNSAINKLGVAHSETSSRHEVLLHTLSTQLVNETESLPQAPDLIWPPTAIEALTSICIATGLIMLVMGFLHLGVLSVILSDQLVSAFSTGAAIHVATSQLSNLFDIKLRPAKSGPLKLVYIWINIGEEIKTTNLFTLSVSVVSIIILVLVKEVLEPKLRKKINCNIPFPIDLMVIVVVTTVSYFFKFNEKFKVDIMGKIPTGLPAPTIPRFDIVTSVIPDCIALAVVTFAISLSLAKIFAKKHKYKVKPNQELIAMGTANIISSFFSCYPCSASLSRTSVQEKTGGKTQMAGIVSCGILLIVLLFLGPFLYDLPKCILSCVILVALKAMFVQLWDVVKIWRMSRCEGLTWLVTFLAVVFLDVDIGLIVGIIFSLFIVLVRFVTPHSTLLGALPYTEIYADTKVFAEAKEIPGVKIYQYSSALFFLNRDHFKNDILRQTININADDIYEGKCTNQTPVHTVVIDCSPISYIDSSGVETLCEVIELFKELNVRCFLCSCPTSVLNMFERTNFFDRLPPKFSAIFPSVHDAIAYTSPV
ncbi:solute carrier family 26 member 10-like protein [Dinothrombium tinctorium]|uniref:Solute carrier family 26 member 10-like protein n=1 Tax=Dinothrombium tinctorium TaxID=1965070 RepID=A0A3S3RQ54_9ACAR|nr:solute carrier family 26 member 10-like protein [Dinothrombium tinctorium]